MIATLTIARELADLITAATQATVSLDPDEAINATAAGQDTVLIQPPKLEADTHHHTTATWTIIVVPSHHSDRLAAWARLDELVRQITNAIHVTAARPYDWQPQDTVLPAYELTINTDHDHY